VIVILANFDFYDLQMAGGYPSNLFSVSELFCQAAILILVNFFLFRPAAILPTAILPKMTFWVGYLEITHTSLGTSPHFQLNLWISL